MPVPEQPDWKVGDWWTVDCAVYITVFQKENASPIISGNILAPFDFLAFPLEKNVSHTYGRIQQSVSVDTFTTEIFTELI